MQQFMSFEVKYKEFRKTTFQKFDSSRQDSFIHWYKLCCSTCLQWGLWCPPYESIEEDNIYGCWWNRILASVRSQKAFMASLIYAVLSLEWVFPTHTKEHGILVHGCPANAGYDALYSVLRLHHPRLQSAMPTVNEIPRQRRAEIFSSYLRRLHEFLARERIAGRNYSEYEALDLSVRNLTSEWRAEFRRLVERDRRTGRSIDTLPFNLTMSQLTTTFVQYSIELGRDVTAPLVASSRDHYSGVQPSTIRRIETAPLSEVDDADDATLGPEEIDMLVRSMSVDQAGSSTCIGCKQSGHTLTDCNRFVDYIVAESLAQRHPQLRAQVAASHSQFRSRLHLRGAVSNPRSPVSASSNAGASCFPRHGLVRIPLSQHPPMQVFLVSLVMVWFAVLWYPHPVPIPLVLAPPSPLMLLLRLLTPTSAMMPHRTMAIASMPCVPPLVVRNPLRILKPVLPLLIPTLLPYPLCFPLSPLTTPCAMPLHCFPPPLTPALLVPPASYFGALLRPTMRHPGRFLPMLTMAPWPAPPVMPPYSTPTDLLLPLTVRCDSTMRAITLIILKVLVSFAFLLIINRLCPLRLLCLCPPPLASLSVPIIPLLSLV
jgi:hypothetical protein